MKYEYIKLASLNWKSRAALYVVFSILTAAATINTVCLLMSGISCIYKITGFIFQLVLAFTLIYAIISAAVVSDRIARPGCTLISGSGMKTVIFLIMLFGIINVSFAIYLVVSDFKYPDGFRGFSLAIIIPLLFYYMDSYIYSDQEFLFIGIRKLTVPLKEIAKVDITRRKLGMGYIISLADCRGVKTKLAANELLKDKFIEFIGRYDAGITIYE